MKSVIQMSVLGIGKHAPLPFLVAGLALTPIFSFGQSAGTTVATGTEEEKVVVMSPFVVSNDKDEGYISRQTFIGSRSAKELLDIPTNVTIINKQIIDDLNATTLNDVLEFAVSNVTQNQNISDDLNIRGFRTSSATRNGVTGTGAVNRKATMYDTEQVEILKGPGAMLTGSNSNLGGSVNIVTRQPKETKGGDLQSTVGPDGYLRFVGNLTGPLFKSDDFKLNQNLIIGRFYWPTKKEIKTYDEWFIGGGLAMYYGPNTSLIITGSFFRDRTYNYYTDFGDVNSGRLAYPGAPGGKGKLITVSVNQYSTDTFSPARSKNVGYNIWTANVDATYLTRLTKNANLRLFYALRDHWSNRDYIYATGIASDNYTYNRQARYEFEFIENHNLQIDFLHKLPLKWAKIDSSFGFDGSYTDDQTKSAQTTMPALDTRSPTYPNDDAFFANPIAGHGLPWQTRRAQRPMVYSYYGQENVALWKDRLILVGGLRRIVPGGTELNEMTNVTTQRDRTQYTVHRMGAVVKLLPTVSVYWTDAANVYTQLGYVDLIHPNDGLGGPLPNREGKLKEFGLKADHRLSDNIYLSGTLSHFDMAMTNVVTNGLLQSGEFGNVISERDTAKGWELDMKARIVFGPGYGDFVINVGIGDSGVASDPTLPAERFAKEKYGCIVRYTWSRGPLKGFSLGAAGQDQSVVRQGPIFLSNKPLTVNLFARYAWSNHWEFQLNLNDITHGNERYIVSIASNYQLWQMSNGFTSRLAIKYKW